MWRSYLYILGRSPFPHINAAGINSQSLPCFITLLMVSFDEQKFFILMKSHLSIFSFMASAFCGMFKKSLSTQRSWRYSPMFSSRSFIALPFTFRFMDHVKLIFMYCVRFTLTFEIASSLVPASASYLELTQFLLLAWFSIPKPGLITWLFCISLTITSNVLSMLSDTYFQAQIQNFLDLSPINNLHGLYSSQKTFLSIYCYGFNCFPSTSKDILKSLASVPHNVTYSRQKVSSLSWLTFSYLWQPPWFLF